MKISYTDDFNLYRLIKNSWEKRWLVLFLVIAPVALVVTLGMLAPTEYESIAIVDVTGKTMNFIERNQNGLLSWQDENPVLEVADQNSIKLEGDVPEAKLSFSKTSPDLGVVTIKIIDTQPKTAKHLVTGLAGFFVKRAKKLDTNRIEQAHIKKSGAKKSKLLREQIELLRAQSAVLSKDTVVIRNTISRASLTARDTPSELKLMLDAQLATNLYNVREIDNTLLDTKRNLEDQELANKRTPLGVIAISSVSKPQRVEPPNVRFNALVVGLVALFLVSIALDFREFVIKNAKGLS